MLRESLSLAQGLPNRPARAPQIPRRGAPIQKRSLPYVKKVLAVASGKGGVGKSTVAGNSLPCQRLIYRLSSITVNLAFALAMHRDAASGFVPRVGILDLDIFGPSIPKLMGLENMPEPHLTSGDVQIHASPTQTIALNHV